MRISVSSVGRSHSWDLAIQLAKRGYLQDLHCGHPLWAVHPVLKPHARCFPWVQPFYVAAGSLGLHSTQDALQWPTTTLFDRHVSRVLSRGDALFVMASYGLRTMARARELGIATVCDSGTTHIEHWDETVSEEHSRWGLQYRPLHPCIKASVLEEYSLGERITVPSGYAKRTFLDRGVKDSKLRVIPYGVDLSRFRPAAKCDDVFRILFVGALNLRKGLPYLLEAMSRLRLPGSELVLIGPKERATHAILSGTGAQFRYLGCIPQGQLYGHYSQASVLVLPSVADGFGLVLAQAMACGVPVIATDSTGAEDLFTDGVEGFIVKARDTDALCQKMLLLYEDCELREAVGRAALKRVRRLGGWDTYGQSAIEMFRELIQARRLGQRSGSD